MASILDARIATGALLKTRQLSAIVGHAQDVDEF